MIEDRCPRVEDGTRIFQGAPRVDPATIGQYIGIDDKNGRRIFEGDIVSTGGHINYVVVYNLKRCAFLLRHPVSKWGKRFGEDDYEVIGNIYDNPELLREENHDN